MSSHHSSFFSSFDIGIGNRKSLSDFIEFGKLAEKFNFNRMWIQEGDYASSTALSACVLSSTNRLRVGTGITSVLRRRPDTVGIEAYTLNELFNGRFALGLGLGGNDYAYSTAQSMAHPLHIMKEYLTIVRGMLASDSFTFDGNIFKIREPLSIGITKSKKKNGRNKTPIYIGAMGDNMLRLAGEMADGLLISRRAGFSPDYVKHAVDVLRQGARKAQRDFEKDEIDVAAFFEVSLSENRRRAISDIKRVLASYTIPRTPKSVLDLAHIEEDEVKQVRSKYNRGDIEGARNSVSDDLVEKFAIAGTPSDCVRKLRNYFDSGLKTPIFYVHGPDVGEAVRLLVRKVVPHLN